MYGNCNYFFILIDSHADSLEIVRTSILNIILDIQ